MIFGKILAWPSAFGDQRLTQFRGIWSNDNVLRLLLCDCTRSAIHGKVRPGLSLRMYDNSVVADRISRAARRPASDTKKFRNARNRRMRNWMSCGGMFRRRLDCGSTARNSSCAAASWLVAGAFTCRARRTSTARRFSPGLMVRVAGEIPSENDPLPIAKEIRQPARSRWREIARSNAGHPLTPG